MLSLRVFASKSVNAILSKLAGRSRSRFSDIAVRGCFPVFRLFPVRRGLKGILKKCLFFYYSRRGIRSVDPPALININPY